MNKIMCLTLVRKYCKISVARCYINRGLFSKLALRNISSCIKAQDLFVAASKLTAASCTYRVGWFYCVFLGPALCLFLVCVGTHCVNVVRSVHVRHRSENRTGQVTRSVSDSVRVCSDCYPDQMCW